MNKKYNFNQSIDDFQKKYKKEFLEIVDLLEFDQKESFDIQLDLKDGTSVDPQTLCGAIPLIYDIEKKLGSLNSRSKFQTIFDFLQSVNSQVNIINEQVVNTNEQVTNINQQVTIASSQNCTPISCLGKALQRIEAGFLTNIDLFNGNSLPAGDSSVNQYFMNQKSWPSNFCYSNLESIDDVSCIARIFSRIKTAYQTEVDPVTNSKFQNQYGKFDPIALYNYYSLPLNWDGFCVQANTVIPSFIAAILARIEFSSNLGFDIASKNNISISGDFGPYNYFSTPSNWDSVLSQNSDLNTFVANGLSSLCLGKVASRIISSNLIEFDPRTNFPVGKTGGPTEIYHFFANPSNWDSFCC